MSFKATPLNLPNYPFKLTEKDETVYIFDEIRKKHLVLTPEEWVRQHFVQHLINDRAFPRTLLQLEGGLMLNQLRKRNDILGFNRQGEKIVVVECKSPDVKITQAVFDQVARYNIVHKTKWIGVTNGLQHYYAYIDHEHGNFKFVEELPGFDKL